MPTKILMPSLSPTMVDGKLSKWLKKEGDVIKTGDIIAEIETDKATMEYESSVEGTLGKILVAEGSEGVAVNALIAVLLNKGESVSDVDKFVASLGGNSSTTDSSNTQTQTLEVKSSENSNIPKSLAMHGDVDYVGAKTKTLTVREALREAMSEEMRANPDVFLMGEEVADYQGAYKISQGMLQEFGPQRVIDTPITEYGFTGMGVGAAFYGLRPIVEYMTFNFSLQAIDHIINSAGKSLYMSGGDLNSPIVFRGINGAGTRVGAQHSQCLASWFAHVPGLIVIAPYSASDAKGLLKAAIRNPNPVVFLEHEILYGHSFELPDVEDFILPIGKAKIEKTGSDVTIVSYSLGMHYSMLAAKELENEGISAEVINLRTLRPIDLETILESVKKTNRVVVVEEGWSYAGIASEVCALIVENAFDYLDSPIVRVCGKDVPMPYASNLEKMTLPSVKEVVEAVKKVCYKK